MNMYTDSKRSAASIDVVLETRKHPNALNLEIVCLEYNKTFAIARIGEFSAGDVVVYLHSGAIMPKNSGWDNLGTVEKYLRRDRAVQEVTLCGIPSGGIVFCVQDVLGDVHEQIEIPSDISEKIGVLGTASRTYYDYKSWLQQASEKKKRQQKDVSNNILAVMFIAAVAMMSFYLLRST